MVASRCPVIAWCFTDGKAGHENQLQGLLEALRTHTPVEAHAISTVSVRHPLWGLLSGQDIAGKGLPKPDLFLVGGPSDHVEWSSETVFGQIWQVLDRISGIHWQLATSRRTLAEFVDMLQRYPHERLHLVPAEEAGPDWLPEQLANASAVWVSSVSVSMVYEALTPGAAVGLLSVPFRNDHDRLAAGLRDLQAAGMVTDYETWRDGQALQRPAGPLDEAGRCATWKMEAWLKSA